MELSLTRFNVLKTLHMYPLNDCLLLVIVVWIFYDSNKIIVERERKRKEDGEGEGIKKGIKYNGCACQHHDNFGAQSYCSSIKNTIY